MTELAPPKFGMGAPIRRLEDARLITGHGRYTADEVPENALAAYVVRSPFAHARFSVGDLGPARSAPGVHLVWTVDDISEMKGLPVNGKGRAIGGAPIVDREIPVLCDTVARYVGDAVAFVVADSLDLAKSAAELVDVDYEALPAVVRPSFLNAGRIPANKS
jgi:carbon-monoxide dehydrogenase large subunit